MTVALNSVAESLAGYVVPGDGVTFVATSTSGDWPATTRLRVVSAAGVETAFTPVIASTLATWTLTVAEVTALIGTRTSGQIQARITHGTGDALRGILAGPLTLISEWTGVRGTQSLGAVVVGPPGPTAVSADADNVASLGTDGLIYVAPGAGTVASVNGQTGAVVLGAADVGAAPILGADDNYVTDAEKVKLANLSGTNTGDQTLPTWSTISGKPAVVAEGATAADARTAIGAGTSSFDGTYAALSGKPTLGTAAAAATTDFATAAQGTDARTPTAHAASHASAGSDAVTLAQSQVTNLTTDLGGKIAAAIVDAKGDLIVATAADTVARLPVGATTGHVLTVDPAESTGLKWAAGGGGGGSTIVPSASGIFTPPPGSGCGPESGLSLDGATGPYYHFYGPTWKAEASFRITAARVVVITALASNTLRLGLVEMNSADQPVALAGDWGTVGGDTTGDKDVTGLTTDVQAGKWYATVLVRYGGGGTLSVRAWPVPYGHMGQDTSVPNRVILSRYVSSNDSGPSTGLSNPPSNWSTRVPAGANSTPGPLEFIFIKRQAIT